jgi:sulfur carrier protein
MNQKNFYTQDKVQRINKILNINGSKYLFNSNLTILELIDYLGFNKNVIVIDYNGIILEKKFWEFTRLQTEDSLEILSIAGGG